MHVAGDNAANGRRGVVAGLDDSTGSFDGGDGGCRGTRGNDVHGLFHVRGTIAEDLDTVDGSFDTAAFVELFQCDWPVAGEAALVDPGLDSVQIDGCHVDGETEKLDPLVVVDWIEVLRVDTTTLAVDDDIRRLSAIEACGDLSVLALTLVTTARGLTLAGGGTTTFTDALVVGCRVVGDGGQDGAGLLRLREKKCEG